MDRTPRYPVRVSRPRPIRRRARPRCAGLALEALESRELLSGGAGGPLNVGMNLDQLSYYSPDPMFVDIMKMALDGWGATPLATPEIPRIEPNVTLPPMDQNGYPIGLGNLPSLGYGLDTTVITNSNGHYPTGTYTLTFDGSGTVAVVDNVGPLQYFTQSGGLGTPFNVVIPRASNPGIVVAITSSNPADYVRNIRLIMPGDQNTYQTEPFNPEFLSELAPFSYLRFTVPMGINSASQLVGMTSAQETPVTYRTQTGVYGMSIQYMVQLCNILQEGMWVNMPVGASSDYDANFAQYVHDNLDPGLKVYIEYGNEVWNNGYSAEWNYINTNAITNGVSFNVETADLMAGCWNTWLQVFAGETDRMERVVATQFASAPTLNVLITQLVATSSPSDPDHGFDVVSGGAYFFPDTSSFNAETTVQQIEAAAMSALSSTLEPRLQAFVGVANA